MAEVLIPIHSVSGHRQEYISLFSRELSAAGHHVRHDRLRIRHIFYKGAIFSLQLEEHPAMFCGVALARKLLGRRSTTLLFRPNEACHGKSLRLRAKRAALRAVKVARAASVFTILPFERGTALDRIATDWIYDPQLWDWVADVPIADKAMLESITAKAAGRSVVVAIGAQNRDKGFDFFTSLWLSSQSLRRDMLFVCAGNAEGCDVHRKRQFEEAGGLLFDRYLTTEEISSLYRSASFVWACYSPNYDQASGIFGRAFQLGIPVIIRAGASLRDLSSRIGIEPVEVPWDDTTETERILHSVLGGQVTVNILADRLRTESLATVFSSLTDAPEVG